jgi:threonine dehydrogenase-like Zn-dependent dehydrogenase
MHGDDDSRLELARKLGAAETVNVTRQDPAEAVMSLTEGQGADVAFEVVGDTAPVQAALNSVRKGGRVALVGNVSPTVDFPLQVAVTRELTVYGSCASAGEYPECMALMADGKIDTDALLSAVAPLADGAAWFDRLYRKEPGLMKVVLKP